jgi:Spy/CpxP family protein refolding chaperone
MVDIHQRLFGGKVMYRLSVFVGAVILATAFLVSTGASQDAKTKTKAYLPPGWKSLGLSKEQAFEIAKIHNNYKSKIKALDDQIQEMKVQEKQEMVKLLTEDQKDKLRKLVIPEETPPKDAKGTDKK